MDLNTKFGLPVTEVNMLKSIPREQLEAMGIDVEGLIKSMGKCPECGEELNTNGECSDCGKAEKSLDMDMEKAVKKNPLVEKQIQVSGPHGSYTRTVWVKAGQEPQNKSGDHHVQQIHKDLQAHVRHEQHVQYSHSDDEGHVFSVHSEYRKKVDKGGDGHEGNIKYFHEAKGAKKDHLKYQSKGEGKSGKYGVLDGEGGRKVRKMYQDKDDNGLKEKEKPKTDTKKEKPKKDKK